MEKRRWRGKRLYERSGREEEPQYKTSIDGGESTKKNNKNNNHHERKRGDKECWMRGGKLISIWIQKSFFIFLLSYPGLGAQ